MLHTCNVNEAKEPRTASAAQRYYLRVIAVQQAMPTATIIIPHPAATCSQ